MTIHNPVLTITTTPETLKAIRAKHGLSNKALAEICGVSPRTIEGWEQGRPMPKPAMMLLKSWLKEKEMFE